MRGFGSVQNCYAHEAQMDKLAAALGMDPVELRMRNAMEPGSEMITGQKIDGPVPVADLLERVRAMPLPSPQRGVGREPAQPDGADLLSMPGGVSNTTHGENVKRGVGYAVGFKNIGYSEGFQDYSTARVRLSVVDGHPRVEVHTAAAEVGQGTVMVQAQIAGSELGVNEIVVLNADTRVGSAGSSSASRQTYITGGAVKAASEAVCQRVLDLARSELHAAGELRIEHDVVVGTDGKQIVSLATLLGDAVIDETREFHPRVTHRLDPETGQADAHMQFAFAAHRAVVDVDTELGLVKVVELATAQDVGKAINPLAVQGQLEGGAAQGLGLAVMEEIQVQDGVIKNASFTDYLLPTILDMPPVRMEILELGDPNSPYGLKGVGEPPTISSGPAIVAAIRAATGRDIARVPVRPHDLTL